MQDSAHRLAPLDQVLHVEQRVQRRADRLDLAVEEAVIVAVPAAMDRVRQHLRGAQAACVNRPAIMRSSVRDVGDGVWRGATRYRWAGNFCICVDPCTNQSGIAYSDGSLHEHRL